MKINRPNFYWAVAKSYIRSFFRPTPIWTKFYVTRHCNFNCKYCGARDNSRKDPTFDEVCQIILKLKKLGCNCVGFMGGEPTLRPDLVPIIEFCSKNNVYTQLSTNGAFLINPIKSKKEKTLLDQLVTAGLGTLNISIDSITSDFDTSGKELPKSTKVLDALIEQKEKNRLIVVLNCVINKKNIQQVPQMLNFCHSKNVMMAAVFVQNPNLKPGEEVSDDYLKDVLFSKSDQKKVIETADYLISKKKEGFQLLEPIHYYNSIKKWIKGELCWNCDGGKYTLEVDTDGKIAVCGYLPFLKVNILDIEDNYFKFTKKIRQDNQKWCTKKCIPSCMFFSSYYRRNPVAGLLSKIQYTKL